MLFETNNVATLEQSQLLERWQQDGSTIKNIYYADAENDTIYTVTAGKKLYIKQLIYVSIAGAFSQTLNDGGGAGTIKVKYSSLVAGTTYQVSFDVPLEFSTDVYVATAGGNTHITLVGWEE